MKYRTKQEKKWMQHMQETDSYAGSPYSLPSCRFLHQYQPAREQLSPLNKTSLCQYAAAASEMPYSDTWPSVEGLRTWATKEGGIKFLRTPIWHVSSVALGSYLSYFTVYFTLFHFFPLTSFSPPIAGRSGTKCPSSLSTPLKFGLVRFASEQTS